MLTDESTDVAAKKNLCICIRYFSEKETSVVTAFVGLVKVVQASGENPFNSLKAGLTAVGFYCMHWFCK